jgi:hypothetical protein
MTHGTGTRYFDRRKRRLQRLPAPALGLLRRVAAGEKLMLDTYGGTGAFVENEKVHGTTVKCLVDRGLLRLVFGYPFGTYIVTPTTVELFRQTERPTAVTT